MQGTVFTHYADFEGASIIESHASDIYVVSLTRELLFKLKILGDVDPIEPTLAVEQHVFCRMRRGPQGHRHTVLPRQAHNLNASL